MRIRVRVNMELQIKVPVSPQFFLSNGETYSVRGQGKRFVWEAVIFALHEECCFADGMGFGD